MGARYIAAHRHDLCAILISWILGIAVGAVTGMISFLGAVTGPVLSALFAVPLITWYPLARSPGMTPAPNGTVCTVMPDCLAASSTQKSVSESPTSSQTYLKF
jgi:hypothetical protein